MSSSTTQAPVARAVASTGGQGGDTRESLSAAGRVGWLFITPNLVGFLAFTLLPLLAAIAIAFTSWNVVSGYSGITFVGLANFAEALGDGALWAAVGRTLLYAGIGVPATMMGGLGLAMLLNRDIAGRTLLRVVFFLPHVVSSVAIGLVWLLLLNPDSGPVNAGLRAIGIDAPPAWLVSETWGLPSLVLIAVWSAIGYNAVIYLSALQALPVDLYEAAAIDGANAFRRFTTVTWPALMPTTTFLAITMTISQSQGFGLITFLTQGGPGEATTTVSYFMYQQGFQFYRFGYAAAVGMISFVGVLLLTSFFWRFQKGRGLYT
ncbi:sugar ABC transporter permease [Nonomuraea turkmeniaca]|uniref:Sugar ABC transporter permease n=1 Tax=Nonomuraea turkmeniaca TaxID=103838 RepID=A0A5S4FVV0_9ACTN|nr:sugar ABC transporter permease [Nonomuraea turkmeniaca]TMR24915.1 sugar ABC transporter permease [Nonomuraea turkmeniaca]